MPISSAKKCMSKRVFNGPWGKLLNEQARRMKNEPFYALMKQNLCATLFYYAHNCKHKSKKNNFKSPFENIFDLASNWIFTINL